MNTSEEGAGMARRRSPRLHPKIQATGDVAGMAPRRSPRLHPQIHTRVKGAGMTRRIRRRRGTSPVVPASLPDDDDMLREILLRLPPQSSSLPRASAVCRRWRGLVADPKFLCSFRAHHHRKPPPLLGVIQQRNQGIVFTPVLDPPDRLPPQRLYLGGYIGGFGYELLHCHHGRVLVKDWERKELVVFDPITGQQHGVPVPPGFRLRFLHGAVLCADDGDQGHVHGGCHSSPFKVVLVSMYIPDNRSLACVYSSETGLCGNLIFTEAPCVIFGKSAVLVGNRLYWVSMTNGIVEFDLDEHSLTLIKGPPGTKSILYQNRQIIQAEDGALGFAMLSYPRFKMWQRNVNGRGVDTWVPWKTVEMHSILGFPHIDAEVGGMKIICGYDEDTGIIFICVEPNVYMVQLKSMQSKRLPETHHFSYCHPFTSFYTPGTTIAGGSNGAEVLHNT